MSKSKNNYIGIMEEKDAIWKKLGPAKTDEKRQRRSDPGNPDDCNIWSMHKLFADSDETLKWVWDGCTGATIGCVDCKRRLLENIDLEIAPIRERRKEFAADPARVQKILADAATWCRDEAEITMREVRSALGVRPS
jgi:tryptophanyl-tRNA synthetase